MKIKGWKKLVNKKNREYWENKERGMIANVEKVANTWYFTKGSKTKQENVMCENRKEAKLRAIKYMRFHS